MRYLPILFSFCLLPTFLIAQKTDVAILKAHYSLSHVRDTTERNKPYTENMVLIMGKNASLFTSADKIEQLEKMTNFIKQQTRESGGVLTNVVMQKGLLRPVTHTDYYFYAQERKLVIIENIRNRYRIDEDLAPINWKISNDTASISGLKCQKATTYFKGRNWIAWFAESLPFATGPWQLNSLPGLIIEAYDERKEVQFIFNGLTYVDTKTNPVEETLRIGTSTIVTERETYLGKEIKIPTNTIQTTKIELNKLRQAIADNPTAGMTEQGGGITSKRVSAPATPTVNKQKNINPIELPEIKK